MKKKIGFIVASCLITAGFCTFARLAEARDVASEISVHGVFIPAHGFDDNDHVVLVAAGELPHICYTLGETRVERQGHVLRVHQTAWLRRTGICATGDADPDLTSPYEAEVSLGQLDAGVYEVQFLLDSERGTVGTRHFSVEVAGTSDIDNHAYAAVSDVLSPKLQTAEEPVRVILQGSLDVSCERLAEPVTVDRQGDVFVVLPIVERNPAAPCRRQRREFQRDLVLGQVAPGRILVHVRAMNGKAVNRIIDVMPRY